MHALSTHLNPSKQWTQKCPLCDAQIFCQDSNMYTTATHTMLHFFSGLVSGMHALTISLYTVEIFCSHFIFEWNLIIPDAWEMQVRFLKRLKIGSTQKKSKVGHYMFKSWSAFLIIWVKDRKINQVHFWSLLKILTFDFPTCNYNLEFYLVQVDIKLDQGPLKKWTKNPIPHRKEPQGQTSHFSSIHRGVKHPVL